jgi:hypothetical protein
MVEILQSYCQISSSEFCRKRSSSGRFSLPLPVSPYVCREQGADQVFIQRRSRVTERRFIMAVRFHDEFF